MVKLIDPVDTSPTITLNVPTDGTETSVYAPNDTTSLPTFIATKGDAVGDDVVILITFENIDGVVQSVSGGTWDNEAQTFTITEVLTTANNVLADWEYVSNNAEDTADKPYTIQITNNDGDVGFFCGSSLKLVTAEVLKDFKSACFTGLLTGTNGTILMKVDGVPTADAPTTFVSNLTVTTSVLVADIQTDTSVPEYGATVQGANFELCAAAAAGEKANARIVTADVTGDMGFTDVNGTGKKLTKGVTGKLDPRIGDQSQLGDDLLDLALDAGLPLLAAANLLFGSDIFGSSAKLTIRREEQLPVKDLKLKVRGRNDVPVPDNFDPGQPFLGITDPPSYTGGPGAWDLSTFITVHTTEPAWWARFAITDTVFGAGNIIPISNIPRLNQQFLDMSVRDIDIVNDEIRNTVNQGVLTDQISKDQLIKNILSTAQASYHFKDGFQVVQDRPGSPTFIINHTVAIEPGFTYSGESLQTKFNVVNIGWYNLSKPPGLNTDTITSTTPVLPETQSVDIVGWGIAQEGQAHRKAVDLLADESRIDPLIATVRIGHIGQLINLGDRVRVADPFFQFSTFKKNAGRILSITDTTHIVVSSDDPITGTPNIHIIKADSAVFTTTVVSIIDNGDGTSEVTLTDALPSTPVGLALYSIEDGITMSTLGMLEINDKAEWDLELRASNESKYAQIDTAVIPV